MHVKLDNLHIKDLKNGCVTGLLEKNKILLISQISESDKNVIKAFGDDPWCSICFFYVCSRVWNLPALLIPGLMCS